MRKSGHKWIKVFTALVLLILPAGAFAKTEIIWWHAMTGYLGQWQAGDPDSGTSCPLAEGRNFHVFGKRE